MGHVKTEAELVAFAKDLLPLIDELRDIQKRSGIFMLEISTSGDPDGPVGNETIRVLAFLDDTLKVLHAERHTGTGLETWAYRVTDVSDRNETLSGTF